MKGKPLGLGIKIGTTSIVWGFATGMLAICIPLVSMTGSGIILPVVIIVGASLSTIAVWVSSSQPFSQTPETKTQEA